MNLNQLGILILVLSLFWSCQNSENNQQDNSDSDTVTTEEQTNTQPQMAPGQAPNQQPDIEVSDNELEQFVEVIEELQMINQEGQQKMIAAVEKGGMEIERYSEIQMAQQDPSKPANASAEEMNKFNAANQELEKIQLQSQTEMQKKIADAGLSETRYQEINMALQSDPELQQKFRALQGPPVN